MNNTVIDRVEMNEEIKEQLKAEFDLNTEVKPENLMKVSMC